jgi:hypothetical protein
MGKWIDEIDNPQYWRREASPLGYSRNSVGNKAASDDSVQSLCSHDERWSKNCPL